MMDMPSSSFLLSGSRLSLDGYNPTGVRAQHSDSSEVGHPDSQANEARSVSSEISQGDNVTASSNISLHDLLIPEIAERILNNLDRTDCAKINLSMASKKLYNNEVVRAHAVEALSGNLYAKKLPSPRSMAEHVTLHMNLIKTLHVDFQIRSLAALLANSKANIPMLSNLIMVRLKQIRRQTATKYLADLMDLQIKVVKRLPLQIRAYNILFLFPTNRDIDLWIESQTLDAERLIISLIDVIESVEHNGLTRAIFSVFNQASGFVGAEKAASLSRKMAEEALKCRGWHAASALGCAIGLLPKIIAHDIENDSNAFFLDIKSLTRASLNLEPGLRGGQFKNIINHFYLLKNHKDVVPAFCHAIDSCRKLPVNQVESAMLRIHEALKECDLLSNHGLCYKNAKSVQCIPSHLYQNAHRSIAYTLPIFNKAKVMTGETVADVLGRPLNRNERYDFLHAIGPYFRAGLCPYPN